MNLSKLTFIPEATRSSLYDAMAKFEINTPMRAAHFISQCMHESADFTATSENLNYGAEGLKSVFHKYFPDDATANAYARQPEKIANKVYANRMGNGDEKSGDGWMFRGRGYIQCTGKSTYTAFGLAIKENILGQPDLVASQKYAALSAAWFFSKNGLNHLADGGGSTAVIQAITIKINGGLNGITDRIEKFNKILPLITI